MRNEILTINVNGIGDINVSATMRGESRGTSMFNHWHYVFRLRIWSEHGSMSCNFHDSAYNYSKGVKKMDKKALADALDCVLSDISMYENDEIKWNYDDEDAAMMKQAERGCKRERDNFLKVVCGEENLWTAIECLTDYINNYNNTLP